YTFDLKGSVIAKLMEDIADNVFNENPLLQQGGDMSRITGATYSIKISAKSGERISEFMIGGKPIDVKKTYRVSSWGGNLQSVGENLDKETPAVYEVVSDYIRKKKVIDISPKSNVKILDYDCGCPKKGATC
ncbi:MAG TPA: thiosulfohydrolase SoxB, partial [Campylobacterales bacterium]|nr:thiosulfohydrolase SoxB [Campylobacterales bacterium]